MLGCGSPPHTHLSWLFRWWRDVVSVFHHSLPSSPLFFLLCSPSSTSFLCFLALWTSLPAWTLSLCVCMGPGTIRKAQNLLKQYSQHGLDGKKGGSNLTPLEGNAPRSSVRCLFSPLLAASVPVFLVLCFPVVFCWEQQAHRNVSRVTAAFRHCIYFMKPINLK